MSESLISEGPHTERIKLRRNPAIYRTGPIFGGRTMIAMGNRPQDHMDRDLLLASLLRDRRLRMFRRLCLEMPVWAPAVPEGIPTNFQRRAQQLIMLGCMQQYLIEKMRDTIDYAADSCQAEQMLKAMEACPPRGALFARTNLDTGRACGYAKLCPWCHARSVQRLYRQLLAGPCTAERLAGKHLVLLRTQVDAGQELLPDEVRADRNEYRYTLRAVASDLGIAGGVILHQATPWVPWYNRREEKRKGFAHIFTLIGMVPSSATETLDNAISETCSEHFLDGRYDAAWLPGETPQALRYLLFGSSYKFDGYDLGLVADSYQSIRYGIQGAAALQPWFLFNEQQAWSYATAMQGVRLYDTFGNWRASQADRQQCSQIRRPKSEYGNEDRQMAFERKNTKRHNVAEARRRKLAEAVLPDYLKLKEAAGKDLGSPALRKALNDAGHAISDRDARWLAKHLPAMDNRSPLEIFVEKRKRHLASRGQVCCQVAE